MSSTIVVWPIIKACIMASQFLSIDPIGWQAINEQQKLFLNNHFSKRNEVSSFKDTELRAWASKDHNELNDILKREKFDIRLDKFSPNGFGVVSILDVAVEWLHKGDRTNIKKNNASYPAVSITNGMTAYSVNNYKYPFACIETKTQDKVFMTIADHTEPLQDFELLQWIRSVQSNRVRNQQKYAFVKFPMIDLNQLVDISWLLKMTLPDPRSTMPWHIDQALQQTKFKMNEVGARVKSAVAIGIEKTSCIIVPLQHIIIDKPFYLWIERPGVSDPIFAGYFTEQYWKDPKDLDL